MVGFGVFGLLFRNFEQFWVLCGIGPHGPRTFTHDHSIVGWVFVECQLGSVGGQVGVNWGALVTITGFHPIASPKP